jgi:GDP-L-fucose synthase
MTAGKRIFIAGHRGMVGSAIHRQLEANHEHELLLRTRLELDLTRQLDVEEFFRDEAIDFVYLAAAQVGGILANNSRPAEFITSNLQIQTNVIQAAHDSGVERLLFLGSSCIYPRMARQPLEEAALLTGPLEPTNEAYAIAKIAGIKMCESFHRQYGSDFRSVMPTNLYGPGDNFDLQSSHVLPALLRKFHQASMAGDQVVPVWGSGRPRREFLHVDDLARACLHVMDIDKVSFWSKMDGRCSQINVGAGRDISIAELAELIATVTGFDGRIEYDQSKPDGTPRKLLDVGKIKELGWEPAISLDEGIRSTLSWMKQNWASLT